MFPFYTPWKHQKTKEMGTLARNGLKSIFINFLFFSSIIFCQRIVAPPLSSEPARLWFAIINKSLEIIVT